MHPELMGSSPSARSSEDSARPCRMWKWWWGIVTGSEHARRLAPQLEEQSRGITVRYITCLIGALALVGLVGCATNPVTGRQQLSIVPESTVIAQSEAAYDSEIRNLRSHGKIVTDAVVINRVRDITNPLIQQAIAYRADTRNWDWEVQVIDKPTVANAYCMAGGKMMILTGLLRGLDLTDDELAQVMAHEVSHALLSHSVEKASVGLLVDLLGDVVEATGRTALDRDIRRLGADAATEYGWRLPNSRQTEAEADSVGIEIAAKAGFDPNAAVTLHQKMAARDGSSTSRSDWNHTHPATPKRIDALAARVESLQPLYLAALGSRGQAQRSHQPAVASNPVGLASVGAPPVLFQDRCNSTSQVDRAACLGQIGIGMHKYDIYQALGSPTEQDSTGAVLRYSDRFLQLDSRDRLTQILDHRPQLPKPVVQGFDHVVFD